MEGNSLIPPWIAGALGERAKGGSAARRAVIHTTAQRLDSLVRHGNSALSRSTNMGYASLPRRPTMANKQFPAWLLRLCL